MHFLFRLFHFIAIFLAASTVGANFSWKLVQLMVVTESGCDPQIPWMCPRGMCLTSSWPALIT